MIALSDNIVWTAATAFVEIVVEELQAATPQSATMKETLCGPMAEKDRLLAYWHFESLTLDDWITIAARCGAMDRDISRVSSSLVESERPRFVVAFTKFKKLVDQRIEQLKEPGRNGGRD